MMLSIIRYFTVKLEVNLTQMQENVFQKVENQKFSWGGGGGGGMLTPSTLVMHGVLRALHHFACTVHMRAPSREWKSTLILFEHFLIEV